MAQKRPILSAIVASVLLSPFLFSQSELGLSYRFHGGIGFPQSPKAFYDYWKPGLVVGGGVEYTIAPQTFLCAVADYGNFSPDEERLAKWYGMPSGSLKVSGGSTTLLSVSGLVKHLFENEAAISPFVSAGAGITAGSVGDASIDYSGYTSTQSGETHAAVMLIFCAGAEHVFGNSLNIYLEGLYFYGVIRNDRANSDIISFRAGVKL